MTSQDKKTLILEAAIRRFSHFGYKRTVIDDIVRDVAIAKGSFYLYFKRKEDLFIGAINLERKQLQEEVEGALKSARSATGRVHILIQEMLRGMDNHLLLARYMSGDPELQIPPKLMHPHALVEDGDNSCALMAKHWMVPVIQDGIDRGEFRQDLNPTAAVTLIIAFVHIQMHHRRAPFIEGSIDDFLSEQMAIFFGGILAPKNKNRTSWSVHEKGAKS
jgi:AcrR family transcriptional regulator